MLTSAKNNDVTMLQVVKKLNLDVVLHFCQVVCKMAKKLIILDLGGIYAPPGKIEVPVKMMTSPAT